MKELVVSLFIVQPHCTSPYTAVRAIRYAVIKRDVITETAWAVDDLAAADAVRAMRLRVREWWRNFSNWQGTNAWDRGLLIEMYQLQVPEPSPLDYLPHSCAEISNIRRPF